MENIGKGVTPYFRKTFICIYCCLVLSQLEIIFSPMNKLGKDLKSSVHGLQKLADRQEPQFCNALKDLASNCVQEFSEDRPHMANVQRTLQHLNRQI